MLAQRSGRCPAAFVVALLMAIGAASPAWAALPPVTPASTVPPDRVGRVARVNGAVFFHGADADRWNPAALNFPVTNGNALWTEPDSHVDLQVGPDRIALAPSTELDIATVDDHSLAASEPQGAVYLNVRNVAGSGGYTVQTPRGTVRIASAGRYEIVAGDADHPTTVTVVDGAAQVTGENLSLQVNARQTASITGADPFAGSVGPITQDAFLTAALTEERLVPQAAAAVPPIVQQMTGSASLQAEGRWQETPQYGSVWYPPVPDGWAPYRDGHWAYVAPWGWTWIDDEAWGFAPFHYGRWAQLDGNWVWVPVAPAAVAGPVGYAAPCYAPALVSFVDFTSTAAFGGALGFAGGAAIGWLPLGPREAYYPPYSRDLRYVRRLNAREVGSVSITSASVGNNRMAIDSFANYRAITVVPSAAMARSVPVAADLQEMTAQQLTRAYAVFRASATPTAMTAGVTPAIARQFNFIPPARVAQDGVGPAVLHAAPGSTLATPASRPTTSSLTPASLESLNSVAPRPSAMAVQESRAMPPGILRQVAPGTVSHSVALVQPRHQVGFAELARPALVSPPARPLLPVRPPGPFLHAIPRGLPLSVVQSPASVMRATPWAAHPPQAVFQPQRPAAALPQPHSIGNLNQR